MGRPASALRHILISAAVTAFVIVNLLVSYYAPQTDMQVVGAIRPTFQIYPYANGGYNEINSQFYTAHTVRDFSGGETLVLTFPFYERFRLDFLGDGAFSFRRTLAVRTRSGLEETTTIYQFDPERHALLNGLHTHPGGGFAFLASDDPNIDVQVLALPVESTTTAFSILPVLLVFGPILSALFLYRIRRYLAAHRFLVLGMLCVCIALAFLALSLPYNHGPDELSHLFSGQWYLTHLVPPSIDSPVFYDIVWGWDYVVSSPDLTYVLIFKLAHCIEMLQPMDLYRSARLSQIVWLFVLFLLVIRFAKLQVAWAYLLSILIVPQIAYTTTYVNGDALSYFLTIAALGVLLAPKAVDIRAVIPVSLFILCNTKTNYLVLLPVALYLLYRQYGFKYWPYVAMGLVIGSYRRVFTVIDEHMAGRSYLQNELLHCAPSVRDRLLNGKLDYSVIIRPDFYLTSLKSLYAKFGYMSFSLPWYFYVIGACLAILLILANDRREKLLLAAVLVVNFASSEYFSMSIGYQPQGRYLLPAVSLLFLMAVKRIPVRRYLWCSVPTIFAVGDFWLRYLGGAS